MSLDPGNQYLTLSYAAVERQGHSFDGNQGGKPPTFLRHCQRWRHLTAQHQPLPLRHPIRRWIRRVQLRRPHRQRYVQPLFIFLQVGHDFYTKVRTMNLNW